MVEVNISDEDFAVLEKAAEKRNSSLNGICDNMIAAFLGQYEMDEDPLLSTDIVKTIKNDEHGFFASIHEECLRNQRIENSKVNGNLIKLAKRTSRFKPSN